MELVQDEPTPSRPLVANSPLPTSLPASLTASQNLPPQPSAVTVTSSVGPSIPSAPATHVTQHEPSPPQAQLPQPAMPCVPPLLASASPFVSRIRPALPAALPDSFQSPSSQLQQQDVRQGVAVSPHAWQRALHEVRQPSAGGGEAAAAALLSPRGCMSTSVAEPPAVSLLDIDLAPTPGLEASIGAIGDMSPITEDWRCSPMMSPSQAPAKEVLLTTNALFDAPTPGSDALAVEASAGHLSRRHSRKSSSAWLPSDENSCENLPMFQGK